MNIDCRVVLIRINICKLLFPFNGLPVADNKRTHFKKKKMANMQKLKKHSSRHLHVD